MCVLFDVDYCSQCRFWWLNCLSGCGLYVVFVVFSFECLSVGLFGLRGFVVIVLLVSFAILCFCFMCIDEFLCVCYSFIIDLMADCLCVACLCAWFVVNCG